MGTKKNIFTGLDSLRGVAAVSVALYHYLVLVPHVYLLESGHLAVDFFFCLSGFVIGHAYEKRLQTDLTLGRFVLMRVIRFYPYYALGLVLGIVQWLLCTPALSGSEHGGAPWSAVTTALGSNLLFLPAPWFPQASPHTNFPVNFPSWSLFLELMINLIYASIVRLLSLRVLFGVVASFGIAMSAVIMFNGQSDLGYTFESLLGGCLRCGFSFFMGVLLFRLRDHMRVFPFSRLWLVGILLAALVYSAPMPFRPYAELLVILVVSPSIVWFAASPLKTEKAEMPIFRLLGNTSYGLYAIHVPIIAFLAVEFHQLQEFSNHRLASLAGIALIAALVGLTALLDRVYDRPMRKALSGVQVDPLKKKMAPISLG